MAFSLQVGIKGVKHSQAKLEAQRRRFDDMRPVLHWAADGVEADTEQRFKHEGAYDGVDHWQALSPRTILRKLNSPYKANARKILVYTGALKRGMKKRGRGHVRRIARKSARVGVDSVRFPYASAHQDGTGVPRRVFLAWGPKANEEFKKKVRDYVLDGKMP